MGRSVTGMLDLGGSVTVADPLVADATNQAPGPVTFTFVDDVVYAGKSSLFTAIAYAPTAAATYGRRACAIAALPASFGWIPSVVIPAA